MKRIIYTNATGGVSIVVPAGAVEDCIKDVPEGVEYEIVDTVTVPSDRTFRNAWEKGAGRVNVNMEKARGLWMGKIREARDAKLAALDIDYIKADEENNQAQKAQIASEKARLRNIPQTFDLSKATTPEQLKALWPEGL